MVTTPNPFCWYDLMTTDVGAAQAFYGAVVGWSFQDTGMDYTLLLADGAQVGGLMAVPEAASKMGAKPAWMGYVAVSDVDDYAVRVQDAGGKVHKAPQDIPGIGRFAVAADPQGAGFILFKANDADAAPPECPMGTPGHVGWRELMAADGPTAFDFYSQLFAWGKGEAMDMGPMGVYQIFSTDPGGEAAGGMMTKPADMPMPPHWNYYISVGDIDAAVERVGAGGGKVIMGPMEVPGGAWAVQGFDPQGALFCLLGTRPAA